MSIIDLAKGDNIASDEPDGLYVRLGCPGHQFHAVGLVVFIGWKGLGLYIACG